MYCIGLYFVQKKTVCCTVQAHTQITIRMFREGKVTTRVNTNSYAIFEDCIQVLLLLVECLGPLII